MHSFRIGSFALLSLIASSMPALATKICRPSITIVGHELGQPMNLRRVWIARLAIDASACATDSGLYALRIVRTAENAPDLEFVEPLLWRLRQRSVSLEFWIDEAVQTAEVSEVADCPCRHR